MSHKAWYNLYNPKKPGWETIGVPLDDGPYENESDEYHAVGPFKTKRGAAYMVKFGVLIGSIEETEKLAKAAEQQASITSSVIEVTDVVPVASIAKSTEKPFEEFPPEDFLETYRLSFMGGMVAHMLH